MEGFGECSLRRAFCWNGLAVPYERNPEIVSALQRMIAVILILKQIKTEPFGPAFFSILRICVLDYAFFILRRAPAASPTKPVLNSKIVAGSGTGDGGGKMYENSPVNPSVSSSMALMLHNSR